MPFVAETFAAHLARAVDLFRDPARREDQKREFRALVAMVQEHGATVRTDGGGISVNGTPVRDAALAPLLQRLELHGVTELLIPHDAPVSHVFELLRALADQPGGAEDIDERLRATGSTRVSVSMMRVADPRAPESLGTEGLLRGDPMGDIASPAAPVAGTAGVEQISHEPEVSPPPSSAEPEPGVVALDDLHQATYDAPAAQPVVAPPAAAPPAVPPRVVGVPPDKVLPAPRPSQPVISQQAASAVFAPAAAQAKDTGDVLADLQRNPQAAEVGDTLAVLIRQVESAVKANKIEQVLRILGGIVHIEQTLPEGSARRHYGIALKRMFTKSTLQALAQMAAMPAHEAGAILVLQRAGADGMEVLLDLLVAASGMNERRHLFNALTHMKKGTDQLTHMLGHHQWFVVRNIAELAGELGLEESVPALAKQLDHEDERVRKAVALALAKIGSRNAAEPLRRALRDKSAGVRLQAALGVGGRKASAIGMPLVVALEEEKDTEVQRELVLALGRIGSPDAVQALIKFAQPSGKLFGRRPTGLRVAAVEALRLAGGPAAIGTLQGLSGDSDRQVKAAAQAALVELKN
jgi:HEAT repeat protein/PBS lyase HEAT-like repeat-containing protein